MIDQTFIYIKSGKLISSTSIHKMRVLTTLTLVSLLRSSCCLKNNVCSTIQDYATIENNDNCWYNPDVEASPAEIAENHGFDFENHTIETEDNYFITAFRIRNKSFQKSQPILLQHGLMASAMCFMTAGNRSMGFFLANKGFDVWMLNHRGNPYSSGHKHLKITDPKFWDFSFHEIALYDIPATLEYITQKIPLKQKIIYVGHSMGTTISFIYTSVKQEHAKKYLKGVVAITPMASAHLANSMALFVMLTARGLLVNQALQGNVVLFPYLKTQLNHAKKYCSGYPGIELCELFTSITAGMNSNIAEDYPVAAKYFPARSSIRCVFHYIQTAIANKFQMYDFGFEENLARYSSETPPVYNLSEISVPYHMFYGLDDHFSTHDGVSWIFGQLGSDEKSAQIIPKNRSTVYAHADFIYAKDVVKQFYNPMYAVLKHLRRKK